MNEQIALDRYEFEPIKTIKGFPELHWTGKRPYKSTQYFPAQLKEVYGEEKDGWINKIFWGDNLQVMSHMLKEYRGKIDLIYIDPPFDSKADYKKKIKLKNQQVFNDTSVFEEKQYGDIWTNDEYLQFMYERLILMKELLSDTGTIYLHSDWHKCHHLRLIMDEVFGCSNFRNEIIWWYLWGGRGKSSWNSKHDNILFYSKTDKWTFNYLDVLDDHNLISDGAKNRVNYKGAMVLQKSESSNIPEDKVLPSDTWYIATINAMAKEKENYPTQKPQDLLFKIIKASSNEGDIVFDCFMGSGTTQAVAMKLGRKFIGADINLGAIQTTTKRLINIQKNIEGNDSKYTGFEVLNVNNYDFFRNPVEARELLIEALEIQKFDAGNVYHGEKDGRMVKILPINRIATKADLEELKANFPYKTFEKRKEENPNEPVEKLLLVCMGHEPDLKVSLQQELNNYKLDIEIVDILRDKTILELKRDAEVDVAREGNRLIIKNFYPMNLLQKLSILKEDVENWRQMVDSIMIDWNYDGVIMQPTVTDVPDKNELVEGTYEIPEDAGKIRIKITDLLSESLEWEV